MEIKITRSELIKGLGLVQSIVERKTTMPILANVLLDADARSLSITATDLEVGVNCIHTAEVLSKGKVTVHAKSVYDIVRELPEELVHIKVGERHWIEINCGKSRYKIVGLSPEEFPLLPRRGKGDLWRMDGGVLLKMLDKTSLAMSNDETRFNLNGVYLDPIARGEKKILKMVATDGHRLSIVERDAGDKCGMVKGVIIPRKGVAELKKLLEGSSSPADLWIDEKHMIIYRDNVTLVIRLVDGQFPPYEQVVPKQTKRILSVDKEGFVRALRRVSVLTTDRARGVKFAVSPKNLEISASNPDLGEAHEEIEVSYKGETFEVGFNAKYFIEALSVLEDDQAVLELGDDDIAPCVLRSELDRGFTHVIMPMRL